MIKCEIRLEMRLFRHFVAVYFRNLFQAGPCDDDFISLTAKWFIFGEKRFFFEIL